ncbi:hypothetical protein F4556_001687 [Kitasatospora gansuensis]|uniref:Uncharacterized protein n=1 Tax=Kitasatospora gansuensis TaxID=258050 RepID=A0A7W7WFU8_9ACTN|nr:hypothetical protein [Kitasatospora gansuensis]
MRAANYARQVGEHQLPSATVPRPQRSPAYMPEVSTSGAGSQPHSNRPGRLPGLAPHAGMLVSPKAAALLSWPAATPLKPGVVARSLQISPVTAARQRLDVRNVGDLIEIFHRPPAWLLSFHRKLTAERAALQAQHRAEHVGSTLAPST